MTRQIVVGLTVFLVMLGTAGAQTPACDQLTGEQHRLAEEVLASEYLYDCCDDTIASCLQAEPLCALAVRLAANVCSRVAAGQDAARIRRGLSRRARSMVGGGTPAEVALEGAPIVGAADASVTVVVYACARCPYCSKLLPLLYGEIADGDLRGAARLVFRTFPIRGHEGSTEAGLGFTAAAEEGRFWEFMLHAYSHFDEYTSAKQLDWAAELGMDREAFAALIEAPATRDTLVASKKEGLVNKVEETPTFFLNGRHWVGDLELAELVDAIEEEAARIKGEKWAER